MPLDLTATLSDLVALASVNPMGRMTVAPEFCEWRVTEYIETLLATRFKIPTYRQPVAPLRDNLLAWVEGDISPEAGGEVLLFDAHQDTVGVEGMTIPPWTPTIRDGRLYGRGSCDVKGGLAAMLGALVRTAKDRAATPPDPSRPRPTVVLGCTVNEEHGFSGAKSLCGFWLPSSIAPPAESSQTPIPERLAQCLRQPPDAAIVAEPTQLDIVVAHKGMVRWRCHTFGRAAHSSNPALGDNAIYRMAPVVALFARFAREVLPSLGEHPLCGGRTLSVGTISGGSGVNTVPDHCTIEVDYRLLPGDDPHAAWRQAIEYIAGALGGTVPVGAQQQIAHDEPLMQSLGLSDAMNGPVAARLSALVCEAGGIGRRIGVPFGTNGAVISAAGVPTVVFGPGSIEQAHTAEEWIALDQLPLACDAIFRLMQSGIPSPAHFQ